MMRDMKDPVPDQVRALFAARGHETYSERVTMAEHALQAAALAHIAGADDALVLAALLHDVGHLLDEPDSAFGVTDHGTTGGAWVAERFADGVSEPVRLHALDLLLRGDARLRRLHLRPHAVHLLRLGLHLGAGLASAA